AVAGGGEQVERDGGELGAVATVAKWGHRAAAAVLGRCPKGYQASRDRSRPRGRALDRAIGKLAVVSRFFQADAAPARSPWMWTMLFNYRWPTHGYEATREAGMAAFAKSWQRE